MDPATFSLLILLGGLAWLALVYTNPKERRCEHCGHPTSGGLTGGWFGPENEHYAFCPSLKRARDADE